MTNKNAKETLDDLFSKYKATLILISVKTIKFISTSNDSKNEAEIESLKRDLVALEEEITEFCCNHYWEL